jgi:hypothetical protein
MNTETIEDCELLKAICIPDVDRVKTLLEEGVDPNEKDTDNDTALHYALAFDPSGEIAQLLIEHDANIEAAGNNGLRPLAYAISYKNIPALVFLIGQGASTDKVDFEGRTAIDWANICDIRDEVVKALALLQQAKEKAAHEADQIRIAALLDTAATRQVALNKLCPKVRVRLS